MKAVEITTSIPFIFHTITWILKQQDCVTLSCAFLFSYLKLINETKMPCEKTFICISFSLMKSDNSFYFLW